jgi:DnaJ-like protein
LVSRNDPERLAALAALGLPIDASAADILSAYRRLARLSHPDTSEGTAAGQDFAHINAAYRFLTRADVAAGDTGAEPHPATTSSPQPSESPGVTSLDVASTQVWPDDPQVVAGPVIIRPLPPESR